MSAIEDFDPTDQMRLVDPDKYMNTQPGEIYTVIRLDHGFVNVRSPRGTYLTVQPHDLRHA